MCSKASNPSDLMQHNVPAAIFYLAKYSVCSSRQRCRRGVRCEARRVFLRVCLVAKHNNMHYARQPRVPSARLPHFGEMFQCRKRLVCCFGALICVCSARCRQFYSRRHLFYLHQTRCRFLCLCHNRWQQ